LIFPTVTVFVTITFPAFKTAPDSMGRVTYAFSGVRASFDTPITKASVASILAPKIDPYSGKQKL
jgi:hypothetical protein